MHHWWGKGPYITDLLEVKDTCITDEVKDTCITDEVKDPCITDEVKDPCIIDEVKDLSWTEHIFVIMSCIRIKGQVIIYDYVKLVFQYDVCWKLYPKC